MSTYTSDPSSIDNSRWKTGRIQLSGEPSSSDDVAIHYIDCPAPSNVKQLGVVVLIHGYPETSYQFRRVITPLSEKGYRVIAPDYRGAGNSSHPRAGYEKTQMAADIRTLVRDHLKITQKLHIVGHDIGGMIAYAFASRYPSDTACVVWGECPIPGTTSYDDVVKNSNGVWHFWFHQQADLPEALTVGRERLYITHFYDRLMFNSNAVRPSDVDYYERMFSKTGAMRCGFDVYRAFPKDKEENQAHIKEKGKCSVPVMTLNGSESFLAELAEQQSGELWSSKAEHTTLENCGHWCAEENPDGFVREVIKFMEKHL